LPHHPPCSLHSLCRVFGPAGQLAAPGHHRDYSSRWGSSLPAHLAGAAPAAHTPNQAEGTLPARHTFGPHRGAVLPTRRTSHRPSWSSRWRPSFLLATPGATLPACRAGTPPFLLTTLVRRVARSAHHAECCGAPPVALRPPCLSALVRWPVVCENQIGVQNRKSAVTCNYSAKCCREVAAPLPFELLCFFM
jgi:hypothetical protein